MRESESIQRRIRRTIGRPVKNFGKAVVVSSAIRSRPEGMMLGAGIYGTGKVIEGRKRNKINGKRKRR